MSLRDLNHMSIEKDMSETSQKHLKRDDFFVTSLRRLEHISKKCLFRDVYETSQKCLSQVFVIFQKYPTKIFLCDFRGVIEISDKRD